MLKRYRIFFDCEKIKQRRLELGMSQYELAFLSQISSGHVSLIENGLRRPSVDIISNLAVSLDVDVEYFFDSEVF